MFIVLLRFSGNREAADRYMAGHQEWIRRGFDDGVFLLVGSLRSGAGGAVVAQEVSLPALRRRVNDDPFVAEDVVSAEILEIAPARADPRLGFLLA